MKNTESVKEQPPKAPAPTGKAKASAAAQELQTTFKLADTQAVKIVNRITGRARFFRRAFELLGFYREFRV